MAEMADRSIKSAERTLALFERFSSVEHPLSVGEVSRDLAIPQASASMLLKNLTNLGYLEYDRKIRRFAPTIRIMLLGSWINRKFLQSGNIAHELVRVERAVHEMSLIGIQNGPHAQYVLIQGSDDNLTLDVSSGMLRSLTCSAIGRVLLSMKPDAEVLSWVNRANAEATEPRLRVNRGDFMKLIERVRANGYAETAGDVTPGAGVIAVAIPSPMGTLKLAAGIAMPVERIPEKKERALAALTDLQSRLAQYVAASADTTTI